MPENPWRYWEPWPGWRPPWRPGERPRGSRRRRVVQSLLLALAIGLVGWTASGYAFVRAGERNWRRAGWIGVAAALVMLLIPVAFWLGAWLWEWRILRSYHPTGAAPDATRRSVRPPDDPDAPHTPA